MATLNRGINKFLVGDTGPEIEDDEEGEEGKDGKAESSGGTDKKEKVIEKVVEEVIAEEVEGNGGGDDDVK